MSCIDCRECIVQQVDACICPDIVVRIQNTVCGEENSYAYDGDDE